ncbi:CMD domain protein [Microbacterium karelineae]|uniref:CMD domain protein n=1 Tax=Microbacterium karelineae TaxID=2654283 RepID=UPI0012EA2AD1|nr:CMD domain protein [Microbacterium karelineae]
MTPVPDVIDTLVGIQPGSQLDRVRALRPEARAHAQGAYEALFSPNDTSAVSLVERNAVAAFVAALHRVPVVVDFYAATLAAHPDTPPALIHVVGEEAARAAGSGPYGLFRAENAPESEPGPTYVMSSLDGAMVLDDRLAAALEHAHMLVLHPRDASRAHLQALLDAGWTTPGIVTLSQLVAFLTFQIRVVLGLSALAAATTRTDGALA